MTFSSFKPRKPPSTQQEKATTKLPYLRKRENDSVAYIGPQGLLTHQNSHSPPSGPAGGTIKWGRRQVMTDTVTPGYLYLLRIGQLINNPVYSSTEEFLPGSSTVKMIGTATNYTECVLNMSGKIGAQFETPGWAFGPDQLTLKGDAPWLLNKAAIDVYGKVEKPKTLALVTAVEMNKTVRLIEETARKMANLIVHAKRLGTYKGAVKILGKTFKTTPRERLADTSSKKWLEWRYGWGPLMMDISGTLQAISSGDFAQPRKMVRSTQTDTNSLIRVIPGWTSGNLHVSLGEWSLGVTESLVREIRAYVMYEAGLKYQSMRAFGIESFPSTAWELLPWSFVIDWFIPVGDWLEAVEPKVGIKYLMTGYSDVRTHSAKRTVLAYRNLSADPHQWREAVPYKGHSDLYTAKVYQRLVSLNLPDFPSFDVRLNKKRALDSISLLMGQRRTT